MAAKEREKETDRLGVVSMLLVTGRRAEGLYHGQILSGLNVVAYAGVVFGELWAISLLFIDKLPAFPLLTR